MSRISFMTWGLLLILIGVQLNLVDSFVLTPRATRFWKTRLSSGPFENDGGGVSGPNQIAGNGREAMLQGESFSNQYVQRSNGRLAGSTNFPYSTPNYRRFRSDGRGVFQAGYNRQNRGSGGVYQNSGYANPNNNSAINQNRFAGQKMITPPSWFCWPPIFLGAVLFLFGAAGRD